MLELLIKKSQIIKCPSPASSSPLVSYHERNRARARRGQVSSEEREENTQAFSHKLILSIIFESVNPAADVSQWKRDEDMMRNCVRGRMLRTAAFIAFLYILFHKEN